MIGKFVFYVYIYFLHFKIYNEIEELSRKAVCRQKNINMYYLLIFTKNKKPDN